MPACGGTRREVLDRLPYRGILGVVQHWQGDLGKQTVLGQEPPWLIGPNRAGELAPDQRVGWIIEPKLQPGTDQRLMSHPQLIPPSHRQDHMDAEAAAALQQRDQAVLKLFEIGPQLREAVDQQDHIGRDQLRDLACSMRGTK